MHTHTHISVHTHITEGSIVSLNGIIWVQLAAISISIINPNYVLTTGADMSYYWYLREIIIYFIFRWKPGCPSKCLQQILKNPASNSWMLPQLELLMQVTPLMFLPKVIWKEHTPRCLHTGGKHQQEASTTFASCRGCWVFCERGGVLSTERLTRGF